MVNRLVEQHADVGELDTEMADNEEQEGEFYENTADDETVDHEEGEFYENTAADEMVDHEEGEFYKNSGVVLSSNNETLAVILNSLAAKTNKAGRVE